MNITPHIILSAGMPRSGSTWMYNAIRLLIENKYGKQNLSSGWIEDFHIIPKKSHMLLKIHKFSEKWCRRSDLVFYSFRDVRDAIASTFRKFRTKPTLQLVHNYVANDNKWRFISSYNMRYETMIQDPLSMIDKISRILNIQQDNHVILSQLNALDYSNKGPKNERYHMVNLLHKNHITSGYEGSWKGFIDEDFLNQIERQFEQWFIENKYTLATVNVGSQ